MFITKTIQKLGICIIILTISFTQFGCNNKTDTSAPPPIPAPPSPTPSTQPTETPAEPTPSHPRSDQRLAERRQMVATICDLYGLTDKKILEVMELVPRHWFVPTQQQPWAYDDNPLLIEEDQTISQPFIVAYMTGILEITPDKKVLEVGTGSGYQAAVLSELTPHVYSIEINQPLGKIAADRFQKYGYQSIKTKIGDGYLGWPEHAPFDAIIVPCAAEHIPQPLIDQLKPSGKMCIPVGNALSIQSLMLIEKDQNQNITQTPLMDVRFVPLTRIKK